MDNLRGVGAKCSTFNTVKEFLVPEFMAQDVNENKNPLALIALCVDYPYRCTILI
jgi:hypothetical protein